MKNKFLFIIATLLIFASCKEEKIPKITNNLTSNTVESSSNVQQKKIIPNGERINENMIAIKSNKKYSLYNIKEDRVVADVFEYISTTGNIIPVIYNMDDRYKYSFIDEAGNKLYELDIRKCYGFYEGFSVIIKRDFGYAFIDQYGNMIDKNFEELGQKFSEGKNFARFEDLSTGFINTKGDTIFKIAIGSIDGYLAATNFYKDVALIKNDHDSWSLINVEGDIIKDINIQYAYDFSDGFSRVILGDSKYNYIDTNGNFLSDINFDKAEPFCNGSANVSKNNQIYVIDKNGDLVEI